MEDQPRPAMKWNMGNLLMKRAPPKRKDNFEYPDHITEARVEHYKKFGWVVYKEHVDRTAARIMSKAALQALWKLAVRPKLPKKMRERITNITPKKFKVFWSDKAKKGKGLMKCDDLGHGVIKQFSGKCIGSYLPEAQAEFTMTIITYKVMASLYGTASVAQLFGPDSFSVKLKHCGEEKLKVDANFVFSETVMFEDRVMASLVTMIDEKMLEQPFNNRGIPSVRDTGTIEVLQGFHHYRRHAARFFHPETGEKPLDIGRGAPIQLPDNFEASLVSFQVLLNELHRHRDDCRRNPSRPRGSPIDPSAKDYVDLHEYLPEKLIKLQWVAIPAGVGDLICWNHWLPYRTLNCRSRTPRIAFDVSYFPVPEWYKESAIHRMVREAMGVGDVFEKSAHGARVVDNLVERYILYPHRKMDELYYRPEGLMSEFTDFIQCVRM